MSNFVVYSYLSVGYAWMSPKVYSYILELSSSVENVNSILQDPNILNLIGMEMLGMPYTKNIDGTWSFKPPIITDTDEEDIFRQQIVGEVYKRIIKPIQSKKNIPFSNKTRFMLYDDKIEVVNDEFIDDINIANIIVNVVSVYIVQKLKEGIENG
jgi:hypothetical protein